MPGGPFFLGFGNYIPHEPWRVPQKFFDMHPLEGVVVPTIRPDDLADLGPYARDQIVDQHHRYETLVESGLWRRRCRRTRRPISFADDRVGIVLDQLASSPRADDTIVAVWSDHGVHIGEKLHITKFTLWERSTRVPLLLHVPGRFDHEQHVDAPVSTMGLGPTSRELCGIESRTPYSEASLLPIVDDEALADAGRRSRRGWRATTRSGAATGATSATAPASASCTTTGATLTSSTTWRAIRSTTMRSASSTRSSRAAELRSNRARPRTGARATDPGPVRSGRARTDRSAANAAAARRRRSSGSSVGSPSF